MKYLVVFFSVTLSGLVHAIDINHNLNFENTPENITLLDRFLLDQLVSGKNTGISIPGKSTGNLLKVTVHCQKEGICTERLNKFLEKIENAGIKWNSSVRPGAGPAKATN